MSIPADASPAPARAPSPPASRALPRLCGATLAVLAVFWGAMVPLGSPWEYAEGDCATWIWMLRHGESLYGAASGLAMRKSNYPPLYLRLVAWLAPSDGAILTTGRLVSLAGFALAAAMVFLCARRATGSRPAGAVAAVLLGSTAWFGLWAAICRPDALAVGLGAAGVACAALRVRGWPLAAAGLFAASLMAKHSLIVFPLGTIGWALLRERRGGLVLAGATFALVAGAVLAGGLWQPLVQDSAAGWEPVRFLQNGLHYAAPLALGVGLALGLAGRWRSLPEEARRVSGPWMGVLAVALPWTVSLGRVGASYNYVFELSAAVSVLAAVALGEGSRLWPLVGHAAVGLLLTLQNAGYQLAVTRPRAAGEMAAARAALAGIDGAVLSEQSAYALSSGHPAVVIPFLAAQMARTGRWDQGPLVRALRDGAVARVLLEFSADDAAAAGDWDHRERFTPEVIAAVRARYQLERTQGDLHVYKPR